MLIDEDVIREAAAALAGFVETHGTPAPYQYEDGRKALQTLREILNPKAEIVDGADQVEGGEHGNT